MSDFLRPEVRDLLWRWRDVIIAFALLALGLWWGLRSYGVLAWIGYVVFGLGVIVALAGIQRARFRQSGNGAGVVQVNEARFSYFGPLNGGTMDINDLTQLALDPAAHPDAVWQLTGVGGQILAIPINATGAEDLFDVFARLPGIKTTDVLAVLSRTPNAHVVVWTRERPVLH